MKLLLYMIILLSSMSLFSQTKEEELFEELFLEHDLAEVFSNVEFNSGGVDPSTFVLGCGAPSSSEKTEITCTGDAPEIDRKKYEVFQVRYGDFSKLPVHVKKSILGESFESARGGATLVVALPNDNAMLGLWGIIFGSYVDDYGETHGMSVDLKKTFKNDLSLTLSGSTNLFTGRAGRHSEKRTRSDGREGWFYNQQFTNENMLKLVLDSASKGKSFYYRAGIGWVQLDSKNWESFLLASGQQADWHAALDLYEFNYLPNGKGVRDSANLELFWGMQKNLINSKSTCRIRLHSEFGGQLNSIGSSYLKGEAGAAFYFKKEKKKTTTKLAFRGESLVHGQGIQNQLTGSVGIAGKRVGLEMEYNQKIGSLQNHVDYNLPSVWDGGIDPIVTMKFHFIFGSWKNK